MKERVISRGTFSRLGIGSAFQPEISVIGGGSVCFLDKIEVNVFGSMERSIESDLWLNQFGKLFGWLCCVAINLIKNKKIRITVIF